MRQSVGLGEIYSLKDENAKGRLISLASSLITAFYNVFITGIFYTGFLSMYGMSISDVGIITFIPLIANCFCVFSSSVLKHFPRRKPILLAAKIFYYATYILVTMWMPKVVLDPQMRLTWFAIIVFIANAVYALFSPGITTWFYTFYPPDNERRTRYITLNHIFSTITSSVILVISGILTDALANSPKQGQLILGFRYFAFFLVLMDVGFQACAKEEPHTRETGVRLKEVFTLPFHYRKFLRCMLMMFAWNFIANVNNGLWSYHTLNHLHYSYTLQNFIQLLYTAMLLLTNRWWRKVLHRYSWIKTFGIANLLWVPSEIGCFFMTENRMVLYFAMCLWQHFMSVGLNLAYANVLYMNLPEENSTAHIAFSSIGCNLFAFLGLSLGTKISAISGDNYYIFLGTPIYSVQYTTLVRAVMMLSMGLTLTLGWKRFTRDEDIRDIEASEAFYRQAHVRRRQKYHSRFNTEG